MTSWNPLYAHCKSFVTYAGILVKAKFRGSSFEFSILNCYGPYLNRVSFWNNVVAGGIFGQPNLILDGDLNFTLTDADIWGKKTRLDPLAPYFSQLLKDSNMIDVPPICAGPTWRNGCVGDEGIIKSLDIFLASTSLIP